MNLPLVSIIIPCHNSEAYLGEAIESALLQTYPEIEIIVIDDGSSDGSIDLIRSFGDRIRWSSGPNCGACVARNKGLALAHGHFIQFLDSDDILLSDKVANQVPLLLMNSHQSVFGWYQHVYPDKRNVVEYKPDASLLDDSVTLALSYIIQTEAPLHWAHNVRKVGGFKESLPCNQDYDFNLRLACSGIRFAYDERQTSQKKRRANSVSSNECLRHRVMAEILLNAYHILAKQEALFERRRVTLAHQLALLVRLLVGCGDFQLAREMNMLAFEIHSSGGLQSAFDLKSRLVRTFLGPIWTERFIRACQSFPLYKHDAS